MNKKRLFRFGVSGACALAAYFVLYIGCTELGMHYLASSVFGFLGYWSVHFVLNKLWTFQNVDNTARQAVLHFLMHALNHVFVMAGLYVLVEVRDWNYVYAQAVLSAIVTAEIYILSHLIFRKD